MKRKQKLLKKLEKQKIQGQKFLRAIDRFIPTLGLEEIVNNFINRRNHEQNLQEVDPQLLEIVFTDIMDNHEQESEKVSQKIKTDVLTQSQSQLLAFCRQKDLINLHQYCMTIKNKTHRQHSYYGYLLVNTYPEDFYIGEKCTHYHCKTTAHKIQQQYGIFNHNNNQESKEVDVQPQSGQQFIVNSSEEEESQEIQRHKTKKTKRKENNSQKKIDNDSQQQSKQKKKHKMKDLLNSQSQQEIPNNKSSTKKSNKMQILNEQQQNVDAQAQLINEALLQLQLSQILSLVNYADIFQYLSENHRNKLSPLIDVISQIVVLNNKRAKKQRSNKKNKSHNKRLAKSKINLKELTLEELISECLKKNIMEQDMKQKQDYEIQQHPNLAYKLLQFEPNTYVIDGKFNAYPEQEINQLFEKAYQEYEEQVYPQEEGEEEDQELIDDEQGQQQYSDEQGEDDQSDYSVGSDEDDLGVL